MIDFVKIASRLLPRATLLIIMLFFVQSIFAQERIITAGFQFKPIFTSDFFDTGLVEETKTGVNFKLNQKSGFAFGMVLRKGITEKISFETGINIVKRNFAKNAKGAKKYEKKLSFYKENYI